MRIFEVTSTNILDNPKFKDWLGDTKTVSASQSRDLVPRKFKNSEGVKPEPFLSKYTIVKGYGEYPDSLQRDKITGKYPIIRTGYYTVFDGDKPIASFCKGSLVVDKKYRGQGIGLELAKAYMRDYPNYRPSSVNTRSKKLFKKAWEELQSEIN